MLAYLSKIPLYCVKTVDMYIVLLNVCTLIHLFFDGVDEYICSVL
jgi:hypothetical protein